MSEEDAALEEVEEVDIIEALAKQGIEDDDFDDDEDVPGELPDDPEALRALLLKEREIKSKRNKSLKKSKQAIHRTNEENEQLRERLDKLERLAESASNDGGENLEQQAQEWADRVLDNPVEAIKYTDQKQRMLEDKIANYLGGFKQEMLEMISGVKSQTNPERLKYENEINMLRNNPKFASLDDGTLIELVKGLKSAKPRGSVGGERAGREVGNENKVSEADMEKIRQAVRG